MTHRLKPAQRLLNHLSYCRYVQAVSLTPRAAWLTPSTKVGWKRLMMSWIRRNLSRFL